MFNFNEFDCFDIKLIDNNIVSRFDSIAKVELKSFHKRLYTRDVAKIYVIKEDNNYLYVGSAMQSLPSRLRDGLSANGHKGYHGYKWKTKDTIKLFVWHLEGLNKLQLENVEAELVFVIRDKIGEWPLFQNEIHFNNDYTEGKIIAENIFEHLELNYSV